jgi:hypothetical protein
VTSISMLTAPSGASPTTELRGRGRYFRTLLDPVGIATT